MSWGSIVSWGQFSSGVNCLLGSIFVGSQLSPGVNFRRESIVSWGQFSSGVNCLLGSIFVGSQLSWESIVAGVNCRRKSIVVTPFDIKLSSIPVLYNTGEKKNVRPYNYLKIARLFQGPFRIASIVFLHMSMPLLELTVPF